ncbi:MAG: nucleotidyltransferase domain-containing protein [Prevotellaceae bacterium]|nr:nucleotidyltransferase domain-containing protein [Prevotellaceae bacterium]
MDKKEAITIARKYAAVVKSTLGYDKIILFGSYAKGNFDEHSVSLFTKSALLAWSYTTNSPKIRFPR